MQLVHIYLNFPGTTRDVATGLAGYQIQRDHRCPGTAPGVKLAQERFWAEAGGQRGS
jgi:TctA family transporter